MSGRDGSPDDLTTLFVFVPTGDPAPTAWMAAHPNWIKIPATLMPRGTASSGSVASPEITMAVAGTTAVTAPSIGDAAGVGFISDLLASAAAPLAALGILLYPSRTASPELDELHPGGEGFDPHPAMPPLPGLIPPVTGDPRPGESGFTQISPTPPHPGFDRAPPSSNLLPGRQAQERGPTVLHQDRNDGLAGGARTNSQRAREAARAADPAVTRVLPDAEWRAHHLINVAGLRVAPELIAAAARAGWRTDDPGNVAALPASPNAQEKLKAAGIDRPVHDSGHRNWNVNVGDRLKAIEQGLSKQALRRGTPAYDRQARDELEKLQNRLREEMMQRDRLTQNALDIHAAPV
jgi:hypothetical protein